MRRLLLNIILFLVSYSVYAQDQQQDSLVRLISADRARLLQVNGQNFRRVEGNALFLHNDTYLKCDYALWNVDSAVIDAVGNVQIIQDKTILTGDSLKYFINKDLAQFRGHVVQLIDKDSNMLRTRHLDYNTKDSIAHFQRGGAMMDKDGSVIESLIGDYYAQSDLFVFRRQVEMFSDSLFFRTDSLKYYSEKDVIHFDGKTNGWYDVYAITSGGGWYNRNNETFYFDRHVHIISDENEGWSETLFYDRNIEFTRMERKVEVVDTVNNSIVLGGKLEFWNEPRRAEVYTDPVIILLQEQQEGKVDSVFISADQFKYFQKRMFEVDSAVVAQAEQRYKSVQIDPMASKRPAPEPQDTQADSNLSDRADSLSDAGTSQLGERPLSQERQENNGGRELSEQRNDRNAVSSQVDSLSARGGLSTTDSLFVSGSLVSRDSIASRDSLAVTDSLAISASFSKTDSLYVADSLSVADSLAVPQEPLDTTLVTFVEAFNNVKVYKSDIQVKCDSLLYCSIDSIARLFTDPIIWYDAVNQITADSMQFVVKNGQMEKGYMLSKAFVISEDPNEKYYHQIKSPEMIGYFRESDLYRFDAIGGASMLVYIAEDSVITTMNQKECRMMMASLKDGSVERMRYYEGIKSDVYPVYDLTEEQKYLKDFNWRIEEKLNSRFDVTNKGLRRSLRNEVIPARNFPRFKQTRTYYPGYMNKILTDIERRKPLIWIKNSGT